MVGIYMKDPRLIRFNRKKLISECFIDNELFLDKSEVSFLEDEDKSIELFLSLFKRDASANNLKSRWSPNSLSLKQLMNKIKSHSSSSNNPALREYLTIYYKKLSVDQGIQHSKEENFQGNQQINKSGF